MCYISAGTSEDFRDDINLFPEAAKGGVVSAERNDMCRFVLYLLIESAGVHDAS